MIQDDTLTGNIQESATYKFFSIYNMLYRRKSNVKIINLGYRPILMALEYIKYEHIYDNMINKYDYKKFYEENIEVDCDTLTGIRITYINDPVNCLRTLFERGKISKDSVYVATSLTSSIAGSGHLNCLRYAIEIGCPWYSQACLNAARNGHLNCLRYAMENGCPQDSTTILCAASGGHLDCIKYLHENRYFMNPFATCYAAGNGHLDCLKYLHEHGYLSTPMTCSYAAGNGHLNCLKYAHKNGCSWDYQTCNNAALYGHFDCFKYAHNNGCPYNKSDCLRRATTTEIKNYIETYM